MMIIWAASSADHEAREGWVQSAKVYLPYLKAISTAALRKVAAISWRLICV